MTVHERTIPSLARLTVRVRDAMKMLGIGRTTLYALIGKGEIETIKIGRSTRILVDSLEDFVARRRTGC